VSARHGELAAHAAVVAAAVLFGTTFVIVKDAVADAAPVPFLGVRFATGAVALAPLARRRLRGRGPQPGLARAGALCAAALCTGYVFQTIGLQYTTASVSAFVTYLLVVLVPVLSAFVLRRVPPLTVLGGVVVATAGLVLLTGHGAGFHRGEALTLGCALAFAVHVLLLGELAPRFDAVALTAVQLAIVGAVCLVAGLGSGGYAFTARAWAAAVYTGVAVSGLALGLQVWGQRKVGPTRTAVLLMIEPVAAALLGAATGERLGVAGVTGAALILAGIAVAELRLPAPARLDRIVAAGDTLDLTLTSLPSVEKERNG